MTLEGFEKYIQAEVKKGVPFIAYWHPRGVGLLRTGPIEQKPMTKYCLFYKGKKRPVIYDSPDAAEQAARRARRSSGIEARIEEKIVQLKPIQAKRSAISAFRREIDRLARRVDRLCVAEFDGASIAVMGGSEE